MTRPAALRARPTCRSISPPARLDTSTTPSVSRESPSFFIAPDRLMVLLFQTATMGCMYCPAKQGNEYLSQRNLYRHVYGWVRALFPILSTMF